MKHCWVSAMAAGTVTMAAAGPAAAHHVMGGAMPTTFMNGLLSGLGHPVIGLDHLAAVVAIGCLAAVQARGRSLIAGYVIAMVIGAAAHVRGTTFPAAEMMVALTVMLLGAALAALRPVATGRTFILFTAVGLAHGYALGESITGAEETPLVAYFIGFAAIQLALALAAMTAAKAVLAGRVLDPLALRLVGAGIAGFGLAALAQQVSA